MWTFLRHILIALKPSDSLDPVIQLSWRRAVAGIVSSLVIVAFLTGLWLSGALAWTGVTGVAWASEITTLQDTIEKNDKKAIEAVSAAMRLGESSQRVIIKNALKQTLKDRCHAIDAKNQEALDAANREMDEYRDQFLKLEGYAYFVPDCDVTLIKASP